MPTVKIIHCLINYGLTGVPIISRLFKPFTADPVKALHFAILV